MMMKKNTWFAVVLIFLFLPSTSMAQEMMHGKWWINKALTKELNLTDTERHDLEAAYTESRRRMIELKSELEKQQLELDIVLDRQDTKKEQIIEQYARLENARTALSRERFSLLVEMREIIGTERFQSLKEMHRDRGRNRMGRDSGDRYSGRRRY